MYLLTSVWAQRPRTLGPSWQSLLTLGRCCGEAYLGKGHQVLFAFGRLAESQASARHTLIFTYSYLTISGTTQIPDLDHREITDLTGQSDSSPQISGLSI